jgi:hypothetical protein
VRESEQRLKRALGDNQNETPSLTPSPVRSTFSDFFALGGSQKGPTPQDISAHKAYMDQYRQLLKSSVPGTTVNPVDAAFTPNPLAPQAVTFGALDPLNGSLPLNASSYKAPTPAATPAAVNALLTPGAPPDLNAKVLNNWNPLYAPPKPEQPKPVSFSVPMMEVPRRRF